LQQLSEPVMSNSAKQNKQRISLNLPPEIQQWLLSRARQQARPLADVAAAVLEEALQQQQSWEEAGAAAMETPAADSPVATDH
jgi:hypothetical protein